MKRSTSIFGVGASANIKRPALVVRGTRRLVVVFLSILIVICFFSILSNAPVSAQPEHDAVFARINVTNGIGTKNVTNGGNAKIYYNQNPVHVNITLLNLNCSMASEKFLFRIRVISVLTARTWDSADIRIAEGNSSEIIYDLCGLYCGSCAQYGGTPTIDSIWSYGENLSQPLVFTFRLYYYNEYDYTHEVYSKPVLEEEKSITFTVVNELVGFSQEQCKVEKGKTGRLGINVTNLDDEKIRDLNITISDRGVFEILPDMREMGDLAGFGKRTTTFDVEVPEAVGTGTYNITVQVAYQDVLGSVHAESKTVLIAVEWSESPSYLIFLSIAAAAIAGISVLLLFRKRRATTSSKRAPKNG